MAVGRPQSRRLGAILPAARRALGLPESPGTRDATERWPGPAPHVNGPQQPAPHHGQLRRLQRRQQRMFVPPKKNLLSHRRLNTYVGDVITSLRNTGEQYEANGNNRKGAPLQQKIILPAAPLHEPLRAPTLSFNWDSPPIGMPHMGRTADMTASPLAARCIVSRSCASVRLQHSFQALNSISPLSSPLKIRVPRFSWDRPSVERACSDPCGDVTHAESPSAAPVSSALASSSAALTVSAQRLAADTSDVQRVAQNTPPCTPSASGTSSSGQAAMLRSLDTHGLNAELRKTLLAELRGEELHSTSERCDSESCASDPTAKLAFSTGDGVAAFEERIAECVSRGSTTLQSDDSSDLLAIHPSASDELCEDGPCSDLPSSQRPAAVQKACGGPLVGAQAEVVQRRTRQALGASDTPSAWQSPCLAGIAGGAPGRTASGAHAAPSASLFANPPSMNPGECTHSRAGPSAIPTTPRTPHPTSSPHIRCHGNTVFGFNTWAKLAMTDTDLEHAHHESALHGSQRPQPPSGNDNTGASYAAAPAAFAPAAAVPLGFQTWAARLANGDEASDFAVQRVQTSPDSTLTGNSSGVEARKMSMPACRLTFTDPGPPRLTFTDPGTPLRSSTFSKGSSSTKQQPSEPGFKAHALLAAIDDIREGGASTMAVSQASAAIDPQPSPHCALTSTTPASAGMLATTSHETPSGQTQLKKEAGVAASGAAAWNAVLPRMLQHMEAMQEDMRRMLAHAQAIATVPAAVLPVSTPVPGPVPAPAPVPVPQLPVPQLPAPQLPTPAPPLPLSFLPLMPSQSPLKQPSLPQQPHPTASHLTSPSSPTPPPAGQTLGDEPQALLSQPSVATAGRVAHASVATQPSPTQSAASSRSTGHFKPYADSGHVELTVGASGPHLADISDQTYSMSGSKSLVSEVPTHQAGTGLKEAPRAAATGGSLGTSVLRGEPVAPCEPLPLPHKLASVPAPPILAPPWPAPMPLPFPPSNASTRGADHAVRTKHEVGVQSNIHVGNALKAARERELQQVYIEALAPSPYIVPSSHGLETLSSCTVAPGNRDARAGERWSDLANGYDDVTRDQPMMGSTADRAKYTTCHSCTGGVLGGPDWRDIHSERATALHLRTVALTAATSRPWQAQPDLDRVSEHDKPTATHRPSGHERTGNNTPRHALHPDPQLHSTRHVALPDARTHPGEKSWHLRSTNISNSTRAHASMPSSTEKCLGLAGKTVGSKSISTVVDKTTNTSDDYAPLLTRSTQTVADKTTNTYEEDAQLSAIAVDTCHPKPVHNAPNAVSRAPYRRANVHFAIHAGTGEPAPVSRLNGTRQAAALRCGVEGRRPATTQTHKVEPDIQKMGDASRCFTSAVVSLICDYARQVLPATFLLRQRRRYNNQRSEGHLVSCLRFCVPCDSSGAPLEPEPMRQIELWCTLAGWGSVCVGNVPVPYDADYCCAFPDIVDAVLHRIPAGAAPPSIDSPSAVDAELATSDSANRYVISLQLADEPAILADIELRLRQGNHMHRKHATVSYVSRGGARA